MCDMCPMTKKAELKMWEAELALLPRRRQDLEAFERSVHQHITRLWRELVHGERPG